MLYPLLPESPHWLAVSGDTAAAEVLLAKIAAVNGVSMLPGRLRHPPPLHIAAAGAHGHRGHAAHCLRALEL